MEKLGLSEYTIEEILAEAKARLDAENQEQGITHDDEREWLVNQFLDLDIINNYDTNDVGFGRLFADVFKSKLRYNPTIRDFMFYDGKRWIHDLESMNAKKYAKLLYDALMYYAVNYADRGNQGAYLKRVSSLCSLRNRNNMINDAKDIYCFKNEDLDTDDYLLNVDNGVLDLSGTDIKFIPHDPDLLLSKICNVSYIPEATCEIWDNFLDEVLLNDQGKKKYLQKICGLSLTGNTSEETCFMLYGRKTRNGKGTFCETFVHLLGDYACSMRPETLAIKQNKDSRQASGDVARLSGVRFCNVSEPPKNMIFDVAFLKTLLGRDSIVARFLHQSEFEFIPKLKLVINTNHLPKVQDDTLFSSERINVISFDRHFSLSERDRTLKDRLLQESELSGILNWAIEGLCLYRTEGLTPPTAVQQATSEYRQDSDKLSCFLSECMAVDASKNTSAKEVFEKYGEWCNENNYGCENKQNFFGILKSKNLFALTGTVNGKTMRNVVRGYTFDTDFVECPSNETPFD